MVNNAGIMKTKPFLSTQEDEFESLFKVNVFSNFWVCFYDFYSDFFSGDVKFELVFNIGASRIFAGDDSVGQRSSGVGLFSCWSAGHPELGAVQFDEACSSRFHGRPQG